ncbi:VOC family protein [Halobacillus litoralis]|uniref:VOC family protein n=1 Tax=Halobacillus litoralis TaxID=45668 RepID=A0A845F8F3_9BACI|nr:VOC family protein [Halobacillus litoralis]MYL70108.1 VOC family protein [Halobacillus litoralis]
MKHQATPYFTFNGNAGEALDYYKQIFHGEVINLQTFGEADFETPEEMDQRVMHAQFKKDALFFMVSDSFTDQNVKTGSNIALVLECESTDEIQTYYDRLKNDGNVLMELQDTFWGATYAKVKDPYGITWDLNYTKEQ